VPHKEGFEDVINQLELVARRAGASIRTGVRMTLDNILSEHPDIVVLATGATPLSGTLPDGDDLPWVLAGDVLEGKPELPGTHVLIVGGGLVGLEAADFLSAQGKKVVLVEMEEDVGTKLDILPRTMLLKRLKEQGVEIHTGTTVEGFSYGQVVARKGEQVIRLPADIAALAVGFRSNRELADRLAESGVELHVVGDAVDPRGAGEAIREGFEVGARL
jgi:NADPH-dependent 2,4-dienoyl-CoA reductase/sulfur reductase-like enzyme